MKKKMMWIVTVIPLIITLLVIKFLPTAVPMHYDLQGNIDRWGSKYEELIFPIMIIGITGFMQLIIFVYERNSNKIEDEKKKAELISNINVLYIVNIAMTVMFLVMQIAFLYQAWEATPDTRVQTVDISMIMSLVMGIVFIISGNYMPKTKRNGVIGFRTATTMKSDENWKKGNKFAGIVFVIVGIITIIMALVLNGNAAMAITPVLLVLAVVICLAYASKLEEKV